MFVKQLLHFILFTSLYTYFTSLIITPTIQRTFNIWTIIKVYIKLHCDCSHLTLIYTFHIFAFITPVLQKSCFAYVGFTNRLRISSKRERPTKTFHRWSETSLITLRLKTYKFLYVDEWRGCNKQDLISFLRVDAYSLV